MSFFAKDLLIDRVAVVTGGGTGIGKEIALTFARHGAKLAIASRRQKVLDVAAREIEAAGGACLATALDVRDQDAVASFVQEVMERYGRLDIVVNNAAGNFPARIEDLSLNAMRAVVDIDLLGTFNVSRAAFDASLKKRGGVVINISAPFENFGVSWQAHAAAAKAGVVSFTRSAAVEWSGLGIRVNAIAPGAISGTEGMDRLDDQLTVDGAPKAMGAPRDIAYTALFLASDAARFISGTHIYVDGAMSIDMVKKPVYGQPESFVD